MVRRPGETRGKTRSSGSSAGRAHIPLHVQQEAAKKASAERYKAKMRALKEAAAGRSFPTRALEKPLVALPAEYKTFADALRAAKEAAGLTQMQLSQRSGVSQAQISDLLNGRFDPKLSTIMALAEALGVSPHALIPNA